ncbi:MAG: SDR family oxidoreductase, partial [Actinobacteria bacterium]|nr:SDR family oxidoreductase [Actinomycetota bacterium]
EDVAGAALFLASDEAAWISGIVLPIDGGLTAGNMDMAREIINESGDRTL